MIEHIYDLNLKKKMVEHIYDLNKK